MRSAFLPRRQHRDDRYAPSQDSLVEQDMMKAHCDLSVVVPVRDAEPHLRGLVEAFLAVPRVTCELVLVDDCSIDGSADTLRQLEAAHAEVTAVYLTSHGGAGVARNVGFERVSGRYTLFFDADDIVHPDVVTAAVEMLDRTGADVVMTPYRYRRGTADDREEMHPPDLRIWEECVGTAGHRVCRLQDVPRLLEFTNFPWNKVLRTTTYQSAGLRFGETPVHNDILGHWYSLLAADRIVLLNQVLCTHIVQGSGRNLTNRQSKVRLALMDALDETYDTLLRPSPQLRRRYAGHYWDFAIRTARWANDRISPEYRPAFGLRLHDHLMRINLGDFARIRRQNPTLADAIVAKSLS
jgi:glycosyltransferase involved in cell wall biosynthesis